MTPGRVMEMLGCCGGVFGVLVVLLVASTLLRAAVALVNRALGPAPPPDTFGQWDDWDSDEPAPVVRKPSTRVVPEPGLATGILVAFAAGLVNAVGYAVLAVVAEAFDDTGPPNELAAVALLLLFGLPLSTAAHTVLLVPLLPTTFRRAALVAGAYHLILVALAVVVGGLGLFAWHATGP